MRMRTNAKLIQTAILHTDTCHFQKLHVEATNSTATSNGHSSSSTANNMGTPQSSTNAATSISSISMTAIASSNEFDFQWNSAPTNVICAFPYIIGFSGDSMEIRLLVNGNLVHTVTMADLVLITAKRDIYFATTAPEFIQRCDHRIRTDVPQEQPPTGAAGTDSTQCVVVQSSSSFSVLADSSASSAADISADHTGLPAARPEHCIQRARSLQKPRVCGASLSTCNPDTVQYYTDLHGRRHNIAKSASCTESYEVASGQQRDRDISPSRACCGGIHQQLQLQQHLQQQLTTATAPIVPPPPNTPRKNSTDPATGSSTTSTTQLLQLHLPSCPPSPASSTAAASAAGSPAASPGCRARLTTASRVALRSNSSPFHSYHSDMSGINNTGGNGEKVKPLRIFRIPLSNLIGNHSHPYHMRSASVKSKPTPSSSSGLMSTSSAGAASSVPKIVEEQHPPTVSQQTRNVAAISSPRSPTRTASSSSPSQSRSPSQSPPMQPSSNSASGTLEPCDRIGMKRDKFNELQFNYGCNTEPLFTSL